MKRVYNGSKKRSSLFETIRDSGACGQGRSQLRHGLVELISVNDGTLLLADVICDGHLLGRPWQDRGVRVAQSSMTAPSESRESRLVIRRRCVRSEICRAARCGKRWILCQFNVHKCRLAIFTQLQSNRTITRSSSANLCPDCVGFEAMAVISFLLQFVPPRPAAVVLANDASHRMYLLNHSLIVATDTHCSECTSESPTRKHTSRGNRKKTKRRPDGPFIKPDRAVRRALTARRWKASGQIKPTTCC